MYLWVWLYLSECDESCCNFSGFRVPVSSPVDIRLSEEFDSLHVEAFACVIYLSLSVSSIPMGFLNNRLNRSVSHASTGA